MFVITLVTPVDFFRPAASWQVPDRERGAFLVSGPFRQAETPIGEIPRNRELPGYAKAGNENAAAQEYLTGRRSFSLKESQRLMLDLFERIILIGKLVRYREGQISQ